MVFMCQKDSFLREFSTKVKSCVPSTLKESNSVLHGFDVILEDTIIFPEGGGQPCDHGYLNDILVKVVTRNGVQAVHFVETNEKPFETGDSVDQKLDWNRRQDHMQQHSGQHLISSLFETNFNINTKSWWLGADISYVDLDTNNVTQDQLDCVEKIANEIIFNAVPVEILTVNKNDIVLRSDDILRNSSKNVPDDVGDEIRIVKIGEIDRNQCCGTHVSNTAQLQMIKLLNVEKSKQKLTVNFLVGDRIIKKLEKCFKREVEFTGLLNGGPASHVDLLKKLQTNLKSVNRALDRCLKDAATHEAESFNNLTEKPKYLIINRTGNDGDFLNTFLKTVELRNTFFCYMVVDDMEKGKFYLQGNDVDITKLGSTVAKFLDGKGTGRNGKFQGKINNSNKLKECESFIISYFQN